MRAEQLERIIGTVELHNVAVAADHAFEIAALNTTEGFDPVLTRMVGDKHSFKYLIGVGFGVLLNHTTAFHDENLEGIISIDISPEVVAMGRTVRLLLKESDNPSDFVKLARDEEALKSRLSLIEPQEGVEYVAQNLPRLFTGEDIEKVLHKPRFSFRKGNSFDPLLLGNPCPAWLLRNYELFRKLALEGRIGIFEADVTDPNLLKGIRDNLDSYNTSNSIIYLSHALDGGTLSVKEGFEKSLPVYELIKPADGFILLKSSTKYFIPFNLNGGVETYDIVRAGNEFMRSTGVTEDGRMTEISVVGNKPLKVSNNKMAIDGLSRTPDAQIKQVLMNFQRLEYSAGFQNGGYLG
tara:strand:- start:850 stop:1905 length:1056 start_codon:yes stop_codon:yes gene_type:complete